MATYPTKEDLTKFYIGKDLADVPKPAAVLDVAIIRRHCERMKRTVKELGVAFRAHVKTHKTIELTELQVDKTNPSANFIASTILEIETLVPLLLDLKKSQQINVLYGIPLVPSHVTRLAELAAMLGEGSIAVMIDHPDQVPFLKRFFEIAHFPVSVFVKVDTGYHRAGLPPVSLNKNGLLEKLAEAEKEGYVFLLGLYSHSSLSYGAKTAEEAMGYLSAEIRGCRDALGRWRYLLPNRELVVSVGATPQVSSSNNLVPEAGGASSFSVEAEELKGLLQSDSEVRIELHAGNYPVLDMQQVSTHARDGAGRLEDEIALSVVAEVCSVYNDGEREKAEALLAAGTLALAREPCGSYPGWGVLSSWGLGKEVEASRLIIDRISQEHGIVAWESGDQKRLPLKIGQLAKVFPNHACVTGAFYGWYFVVDSDRDPGASKIVDIWVRGRGSSVTDPLLATRYQ
ncbi:hypothetical protein N7520_009982 [Penicillium odoratum]|uniref:uncharacterized protein n=1 Tax=Penicillium odoratum TaxID=1167516 RepID=UPI002548E517|nr:uncharacterized protein N7520_009982 [Penicillium odoratum]KAJ5753065.1 hypothetical protein N7520_009982 [Penicillium odoratum]